MTSKDDCRLSINGWFHTKIPPVFEMPFYKRPRSGLFGSLYAEPQKLDLDLESWINPDYLEQSTMNYIQNHIEENSEISLKHFFKSEVIEEVLQILQHTSKFFYCNCH